MKIIISILSFTVGALLAGWFFINKPCFQYFDGINPVYNLNCILSNSMNFDRKHENHPNTNT